MFWNTFVKSISIIDAGARDFILRGEEIPRSELLEKDELPSDNVVGSSYFESGMWNQ